MNFEHELETLRENMDAMGKGDSAGFCRSALSDCT